MINTLKYLGACYAAEKWVTSQKGNYYDIWRRCPRGDWMLWLAAKTGVDRKLVVLAACGCARTALKYVPDGELRPLTAIETAEAWCRGKVTLDEIRFAADNAAAYAYAAYAAYAADNAAAYAAYAANAAAYAAYAAYAAPAAYAAHAYAANTAVYAAEAAATYTTRVAAATNAYKASLAESAVIVRRVIPWRVVRDALEAR